MLVPCAAQAHLGLRYTLAPRASTPPTALFQPVEKVKLLDTSVAFTSTQLGSGGGGAHGLVLSSRLPLPVSQRMCEYTQTFSYATFSANESNPGSTWTADTISPSILASFALTPSDPRSCMALAARSLGSWNGDRHFVFGGWWSPTGTLFWTVWHWYLGCISVAGAVVVLVRHGSGVRGQVCPASMWTGVSWPRHVHVR